MFGGINMKQYEVVYGKANWRSRIGVWAKNVNDARRQVEENLKNGATIIKIIELWNSL